MRNRIRILVLGGLLCAAAITVYGGAKEESRVEVASAERTPSYEIVPLPEGYKVNLIVEDEEGTIPSRRIHVDFQTRNLTTNQMICLFFRSQGGEYYPIPAHQLTPRVLPINRKTTASIDLYGHLPSEEFNICFFALDDRDQRRMRKWLLSEYAKGAFYMTQRAVELGCVALN